MKNRLWAAAILLSLPAFLFPLCNPDLFWHLSAGRWIIEHHAVPRADFLSFSMPSAPWVDFEWLSQLIFQILYKVGGMTALWILKIALLLASWLLLDRFLIRRKATLEARTLALVFWSAGMLAHSDIRPELFSVLFLSALLTWLEEPSPIPSIKILGLFALWANLHAGFVMGLALILFYAAAKALQKQWPQARERAGKTVLAVAGTLANPYFFLPYETLWRHFVAREDLSRVIKEWAPLSFDNPLHWPFWPMLLVVLVLVLRSRRLSSLAIATLMLAISSLMHGRNAVFFAVLAAASAALSLQENEPKKLRPTFAAGLAVYATFLLWLVPRASRAHIFNDKFLPRAAAEFMAEEKTALQPLRLYNQWEWGGYLGWRLAPWYKVFCDGRYIFHDQLVESGRAVESPELWQGFMSRQSLSGGLMLNLDWRISARKRYPDGSLKDFPRPWYVFYMPRDTWALVYWDEKALLFVDRRRVPAGWLAEHEYRYARPKDEPAFQEALRLHEIPAEAAAAEAQRHARELAHFSNAES